MDGIPVWHTASRPVATPVPAATRFAGHSLRRINGVPPRKASRRCDRDILACIDAAYDVASRSAEEALRRLTDYEARLDRAFARHWQGSGTGERRVRVPALTSTETPKGARPMRQTLPIRTTGPATAVPPKRTAIRSEDDGSARVADRSIRLAEQAFATARLACAPSFQPDRRSLFL